MARDLVISAGPGEWRAALLEEGALVALFVERGDALEVGSIHLGRVTRLAPGLSAAFVDLGEERPAFLPFAEALPEGRKPQEGARVLVQLRREAQAGKAARVTMRALLCGRTLEFRASRKELLSLPALSEGERDRLQKLLGEGNGLRLLGALPLPFAGLLAEAGELAQMWRAIEERALSLEPPARLAPSPARAFRLAAQMPLAPQRIFADDHAALPELRAAFPDASLAHRAEGLSGIDLDGLFDNALAPSLPLGKGGALHFERTRAGLLIDVDSGMREEGSIEEAALAANLEAASLIARELRLRNLGGGIIVDFVGLDRKGMRERVCAELEKALAADRASPRILGWTRLGHLELVRPRKSRSLAEVLLDEEGGRKSAATIAFEALRAVGKEARARPGCGWRLAVSAEVSSALGGKAAAGFEELQKRLSGQVLLATLAGAPRERFEITPLSPACGS